MKISIKSDYQKNIKKRENLQEPLKSYMYYMHFYRDTKFLEKRIIQNSLGNKRKAIADFIRAN